MPTPSARKVMPRQLSSLGTSDAALALLVISVVGLMIVPLPTWLLDILLATNISMAVGVLLVVLYIPDALSIATFPTLLLLTTLFRLALNVSSSRLILLHANAGQVIRSFGQFVVQGNYVVGAVIFLVLTVIQFVVIAKGSERVAEVGARFVLDAMPGKQMAIDAELRAGNIDPKQARFRRRQLSRESQFYGAMDGAMKFVKGDVIASLVITVVNIVGGLAVGVLQKDMNAVTALKRYGLLTIGDGLVSQIPALVLATAAGLLVTRVASEDPDTSLGNELARQLFGTPKAIRVAGVFVTLLAIVPGLPTAPFLIIGVSLLLLARSRTKHLRKQQTMAQERVTQLKPRGGHGASKGPEFLPMVTPWIVDIADNLAPLLDDVRRGGDEIERAGVRTISQQVRDDVFAALGVPLPPAVVRVNETLPPNRVVISLFEVPYRAMELDPSTDPEEQLAAVRAFLGNKLQERASDFLGIGETKLLLDQLEQVSPALARQLVPKPLGLALLADILRRLVEERVSVRDLRTIIEALATASPTDKDPLSLTELVRSHLRRATTFQLAGGSGALDVYLLDPEIEDMVRSSIQRTPAGSFLALAPSAAREIVEAIKAAAQQSPPPPGKEPVLLTQPDIRRFVRKLIEGELPEMRVLSHADLMPETSVRPLMRVMPGMGGV